MNKQFCSDQKVPDLLGVVYNAYDHIFKKEKYLKTIIF